jgi:hypothetical protein
MVITPFVSLEKPLIVLATAQVVGYMGLLPRK